jgi:hypothetical protein
MEPRTQDVPGYYVWEVPGKDLVVHLHLEVIDGLLSEVMRGFGAVPKRGAEVGGVLIGSIERGELTVVRIEDFEPVECAYKRGPSYLFTEDDGAAFDDACERWQPDPSRPAYAVGLFRSHTRDGLSLSPEDIELLDRYFKGPSHIALLVKPFATKASLAGFFFREDGVFPDETPLQFPFRRRDLTGEEPPPRRSLTERGPRERRPRAVARAAVAVPDDGDGGDRDLTDISQAAHAYAVTTPSRSRLGGWMWIPLSFVFLLLGVALGFQAATSMVLRPRVTDWPDFSLGLKAAKTGDNLKVEWNPESPQIRSAQRGVLEIQDGTYSKPVDLDTALLQNGAIIYRNVSNVVHLRLIVYLNPRLSVTETLDWRP